jgi:hypothetical protein
VQHLRRQVAVGAGEDVTLDGVAGVSEPIARIEQQTGAPAACTFTPMSRKVKSVASHAVRPHGGWNYTPADEAEIFSEVLKLTTAPPDSKKIAAYYHAWRLGSSEIAAQVANDRRSFGCVPGASAGEVMLPISRAATLGPKCHCI